MDVEGQGVQVKQIRERPNLVPEVGRDGDWVEHRRAFSSKAGGREGGLGSAYDSSRRGRRRDLKYAVNVVRFSTGDFSTGRLESRVGHRLRRNNRNLYG